MSVEALPHPACTCDGLSGSAGNQVVCVDLIGPSTGAFDLYGSADSYTFVGFDWLFTASDGNNTDVASWACRMGLS